MRQLARRTPVYPAIIVLACAVSISSGKPSTARAIATPPLLTESSATSEAMRAKQLAAIISQFGVTSEMAEQDLDTQDAASALAGPIESALGDAFAGVWFDNRRATFDVGIAPSASAEATHKVEALIASSSAASSTRLVPVTSTFQELRVTEREWSTRAKHLMTQHQALTAIDPADNAVVIRVAETAPATEVDALSELATQASLGHPTIKVEQVSHPLPLSETGKACIFAPEPPPNETHIDGCNPPLVTGTEIYDTPEVYGGKLHYTVCTAGFMAASINEAAYPDHYLLTAGHCLKGGAKPANGVRQTGQAWGTGLATRTTAI